MKRFFYVALAIAGIISIGVGLFSGYAALQHNPNNQFCMYPQEGCTPDWLYLVSIIFSWLLVAFAVQAILILVVGLVWRGINKNKK